MQAIITKYLAPTDFCGARISARAAAGVIVVQYRFNLNNIDNHKRAAKAFAKKYAWAGTFYGGSIRFGSEMVWVAGDTKYKFVRRKP
ncbi:MAG: hypothetical protein WC449_05260 [Candidatus Paceibacterota bacterium]